MKEKLKTIIYFSILLIAIFITIYIICNPVIKEFEYAIYNTTEKPEIKTFSGKVRQKIYIEKDNVFKILFFLNKGKFYDNVSVKLIDENNNEIYNNYIDEYQKNPLFSTTQVFNFEIPYLEKHKVYTLILEDLDGENIDLAIVNKKNSSYLENEDDSNMQLITYYKKESYSNLWYTMFIFMILFTIYPFIFKNKIKVEETKNTIQMERIKN